jgi:uncharacterized protein (DUF305 family)
LASALPVDGDLEPDGTDEARQYGVLAVLLVAALTLVLGFGAGYVLGRPTYPTDTSVDAGFARDMSSHHAQGVDMAMTIQRGTDDLPLRQLGTDIALTQQAQIGMMQAWLGQWGLPPNGSEPRMAWMAGHMHGSAAEDESMSLQPNGLMPGMATPEEIQRLRSSTGTAQEVLFCQLMIRHHRAGVEMAKAALEMAAQPVVRELAQTMVTGQTKEITLLTAELTERGGTPLPD